MSGGDRAGAMARRLAATAERLGMPPESTSLVLQAYGVAMDHRKARIDDERDPDFLHPARTVLILMDDLGETDDVTLAAAALCETRDRKLACGAELMSGLDERVTGRLAEVPRLAGPGGPDILELLVGAPEPARRIALAERLDHARHLHLRDRYEWREYHSVCCRAYAVVARRTHPVLEQRWTWWCRTFEERFLKG